MLNILFGFVVLLVQVTAGYQKSIKIACNGETLKLDCPRYFTIEILSANYGRTNKYICNPTGKPIDEMHCISSSSKIIIENKCNKKRHCSIMTSNSDMGGDPCPKVLKYVDVIYSCVRNLNPVVTSQPISTTQTTTTMKQTVKHVTTTPYLGITRATAKFIEPNTTVETKAILRKNGGDGFFRSMLLIVSLIKGKPKHSLLSVLTGVAAGTVIILATVLACVCVKKRRDKNASDNFNESNGKRAAEVVEMEKSELLSRKTETNSDSAQSADHVDSAFGDDEPDRGKSEEFEMSNDMAYLDNYLQEHNQNKSLPRPLTAQNSRSSLRMSRRAHNDGSKGRSYDYNSNNENNFTTFS